MYGIGRRSGTRRGPGTSTGSAGRKPPRGLCNWIGPGAGGGKWCVRVMSTAAWLATMRSETGGYDKPVRKEIAMAYMSIIEGKAQPGRAARFAQDLARYRQIVAELGAELRLFRTVYGGEQADRVTAVFEWADLASLEAFQVKTSSSAAYQEHIERMFGSEGSAVLISRSLAKDL